MRTNLSYWGRHRFTGLGALGIGQKTTRETRLSEPNAEPRHIVGAERRDHSHEQATFDRRRRAPSIEWPECEQRPSAIHAGGSHDRR